MQLVLKSNKHGLAHRRIHNPISLLSGLLICEQCGSRMRPRVNSNKGLDARGTQTFSYLCDLKKRSKGQKCSCENLNGNEVDRVVSSTIVENCKVGADLYDQILKLKNTAIAQKKTSLQMTDSFQQKILETEDKIQSLIAILAKKPNSITLYRYTEAEVEKLDQRLSQLNDQLLYWRNEQENANLECVTTAAVEARLRNMADAFAQRSIYEKREFISSLVDKIIWDGTQVHVYLLGQKVKV